ncbi:MAG TPA: flagellar basal-body MS-ring/collar protein FliF [Candidatus Aminicenantes bacterium]|nr:flagellar basal-body MS-ring/collar protein FliF [Candidatus Aminicenantes bacterium]
MDPLAQFREILKKFSNTQKIFIAVVVLSVLGGLTALVFWANTPEKSVLFSNLSENDAGEIVAKLKEMKVEYTLRGTTILVPDKQVNELRLSLASQGIPKGSGIGFEVFDKSQLGMTEFMEQMNYLRALEGELSRTISSIKEVKAARIHIVLPKKSVFLEEQEPSKASIILSLHPGATVSPSTVASIVHLTSSAVEGLSPQNITVIDVYGRLLASPESGDEISILSAKQIDVQEKVGREISRQINSLLEPIVGIGKVRSNVRAELDFTKQEKVEEIYDPNVQIERSEKTESEKSGNAMGGGTPGTASNVAGAGIPVSSTGNQPFREMKSETKNYEINKTLLKSQLPYGTIKRLAVSVVVDDGMVEKTVGKEKVWDKAPRSPQELSKIRQLVTAAVGYNQARGDLLEVANLPFDDSELKQTEAFMQQENRRDLIKIAAKYGTIFVLVILFIFLVLKPMTKKIFAALPSREAQAQLELKELTQGAEGGILGPDGTPVPQALPKINEAEQKRMLEQEIQSQFQIPKETQKTAMLREKLKEFADTNTDELSTLVKSMLSEL